MVAKREFGEPVMTFTEAAGWLERRFGRRPNVASVWRWATRGVRGVRLATIALGRFRYTTESALERFIAESSQLRTDPHGRGSDGTGTSAATGVPEFTKVEIAAATKRREQEKTRAREYLRSRLGSGTSASKATAKTSKERTAPPS
jgi:hypothetical protein